MGTGTRDREHASYKYIEEVKYEINTYMSYDSLHIHMYMITLLGGRRNLLLTEFPNTHTHTHTKRVVVFDGDFIN